MCSFLPLNPIRYEKCYKIGEESPRSMQTFTGISSLPENYFRSAIKSNQYFIFSWTTARSVAPLFEHWFSWRPSECWGIKCENFQWFIFEGICFVGTKQWLWWRVWTVRWITEMVDMKGKKSWLKEAAVTPKNIEDKGVEPLCNCNRLALLFDNL